MDYSAFRANLSDLMQARGFSSNNSLSIELGVPAATISRWRTGDRSPDLEYVIKIADFFGVSIDWLLGFDTVKYSKLNSETEETIRLYLLCSPADKKVIDAVLEKYKEV